MVSSHKPFLNVRHSEFLRHKKHQWLKNYDWDNDRDRVVICDVRCIFNDIKVATIPLLHIQNINFGQFVEMDFHKNPF